jgi:hypothetical protein
VARVRVRTGLNRLAQLTTPAPVQRCEYSALGALVHLDVKPLVRILRVGHRIHGDRRAVVKGAGWEYVHVAVDEQSRVASRSKSCPINADGPPRRFCVGPSAGSLSAASRYGASSPTTVGRIDPRSFGAPPIARPFAHCDRDPIGPDERQG